MGRDILVVGLKGAGKNLIITIIESQLPKKKKFSTFELKLPGYQPLTLVGMLNLPEGVIVNIDEAYTWIESRHSSKYINVYLSHLNFQLRKSNRDFFITAQLMSSIDKRFREHYDYIIYCSRLPNENPNWEYWDFFYIFVNNITNQSSALGLSYEDAVPFFKYFDTYEIQEAPAKSRMIYELLKTDPLKKLAYSIKITNKLMPYFDKKRFPTIGVTKDLVKIALMKVNQDEIWSNDCYLILKNYNALTQWVNFEKNNSK